MTDFRQYPGQMDKEKQTAMKIYRRINELLSAEGKKILSENINHTIEIGDPNLPPFGELKNEELFELKEKCIEIGVSNMLMQSFDEEQIAKISKPKVTDSILAIIKIYNTENEENKFLVKPTDIGQMANKIFNQLLENPKVSEKPNQNPQEDVESPDRLYEESESPDGPLPRPPKTSM